MEDIETAFRSEESVPEANDNKNTTIASPATGQISPVNDEYWDAVNNTYKKKKDDNEIRDMGIEEEDTNEEQERDSSMRISSALANELDSWEYWDPISDSYKQKNPSKGSLKETKEEKVKNPVLKEVHFFL